MADYQTLKQIDLGRKDYKLCVLKEVNANEYVSVIYRLEGVNAEGREIFRSYPYAHVELAEQAAKEYYLHLSKPAET